MQISEDIVREEYEEVLQRIREGIIEPTEKDKYSQIFYLKLKICFFFRFWCYVLLIWLIVFVVSFLFHRDTSVPISYVIAWLLLGGIWLLTLQRQVQKISKTVSNGVRK